MKRSLPSCGFSLIDLMVGLAIGMLVTLAVTNTAVMLTIQRNNTLSGNDARDGAQAALSTLERAGKMAGVGLFYNKSLLCSTLNSNDTTPPLDGVALSPISITAGGATESDKITVAYGLARGAYSVSSIVGASTSADQPYLVASAGALEVTDQALVGVPGSTAPCTLFKVTGLQPVTGAGSSCNNMSTNCVSLTHSSVGSSAITPIYSHTGAISGTIGPAVVARLGAFHYRTYDVLCKSLVSYPAGSAPTNCTNTNVTRLASDVVMLKAQYGISDKADSTIVTSWSSASPTDQRQIKAIRVVVVSRFKEPAMSDVSQGCITPANPDGPCSFQDAEAPVINLSTLPLPGGLTWKRYRYHVYFSVIPLRSVIWNS